MIELFEIYKYAFFLCPFVAGVLSLLGTHLVSRDQSLQLMALAQAALVGNILGHLIAHENSITSLTLSLVFFIVAKWLFSLFKSAREQTYIVVYLLFMALSYFVVTLFPSLDSHFAIGFFGDIVSISVQRSIVLTLVFALLMFLYIFNHKKILRSTVNISILKIPKLDFFEEAFFVLGILLSLYGLGFLFTMAYLIFPIIVVGNTFKTLRSGLVVMVFISALSSVLGLALSIVNSRVATVPAQVLILVLVLLLYKLLFNPQLRRS